MIICHQPYSELENIPIDVTVKLFVRFITRIGDILKFVSGNKPSSKNDVVPDGNMADEEIVKIAKARYDKIKNESIEDRIDRVKKRIIKNVTKKR